MVQRQWSWKRSWPRWARKLVTDGTNSFYRVLVDPRDGAPLEIGRKNYRLPEAVKRWLRMRDGKGTFPGCTNHTLDNETDHLLAWHHGGTTGVSNLGQACPKHHRLKHTSTWTPTPATKNEPPGWTSPTGRHYTSKHQDGNHHTGPQVLYRISRSLDLHLPQRLLEHVLASCGSGASSGTLFTRLGHAWESLTWRIRC